MLNYNKTHVLEGIAVNKTHLLKECLIWHYWYF